MILKKRVEQLTTEILIPWLYWAEITRIKYLFPPAEGPEVTAQVQAKLIVVSAVKDLKKFARSGLKNSGLFMVAYVDCLSQCLS